MAPKLAPPVAFAIDFGRSASPPGLHLAPSFPDPACVSPASDDFAQMRAAKLTPP